MKINVRNRAFFIFMAVTLLCNFIPITGYAMPVDVSVDIDENNTPLETVSGNDIQSVSEEETEEAVRKEIKAEELLLDAEGQKPEEIMLSSLSPVKLKIISSLQEGCLLVQVLRGEKGVQRGSTYLVNREDDWTSCEVIEENPFFTVTKEDEPEDESENELENETENEIENDGYDYWLIVPKTIEGTKTVDEYEYFLRVAVYDKENISEAIAITTLPVIIEDEKLLEEELEPKTDDSMDEAAEDSLDEASSEDSLDEAPEDEMAVEEEAALDIIDENVPKEHGLNEVVTEETECLENAGIEFTGDVSGQNIAVSDGFTEDVSGQNISVSNADTEIEEIVITVSKVTLNKTNETLHPGEVWKAIATVSPQGLNLPVNWSSSKEEIAVVDETGTVTAIADGTAVITAECGGKAAFTTIEVVTEDAIKNNDVPEDESGNRIELSDEIWIAGYKQEDASFVYNGSKITQNLRVYHKGTLLKEKTDYTLSYRNNVNASPYNGAKAPSVTVTMKGQYTGSRTLYYTILPRDIDENDSAGYEQIIYYAKNLKLSAPNVYYGNKKLTNKKDFICDYSTLPEKYTKGDSYEEGVSYEYTVKGIGNYTGSFTMKLTLLKNKNYNFGNATVVLDKKQYVYAGCSLAEDDVKILSFKLGGQFLSDELYTYEVYADAVGKGYLNIVPTKEGLSKGYRGTKKVTFKVVGDRSLKDAVKGKGWQDTLTFSGTKISGEGGMYQPKTEVLVYETETSSEILTEGIDYSVKYTNCKKVGTATVTFTGMGRYTGSYKATYRIVPNTDLLVEWTDTDENGMPVTFYQKGGANPKFMIREDSDEGNGICLNSKSDYSVKLTNHGKIGIMTCVISGKGNYKGFSHKAEITVREADISAGTMVLEDKKYTDKKSSWWKSSVTIKDINGKKLTPGTDYDKNLIYSYEGMEEAKYPKAGDIVYVTAKGINAYAGSVITGSYRIYQSKLSGLVIVIDSKEYTGKEVTLSAEDIHVYASSADRKVGKEMEETCYEIVNYSNNLKAGTAKVTLRGLGNYGGTKVCTFKITKKKYLTTRVTSISLSKKSLTMGVGNTEQLTAVVLPEDAVNKTIIWSSSNSKVAEVTTEGLIYAKAAGTAKIKALSQDTGKSVSCNIKVSVIPIVSFVLNQTEINGMPGEVYELRAEEILPENGSYHTIRWESTHPEVASVDEEGTVTLHKPGMAVVKAFAADGEFVKKCLVFVKGTETEAVPEGEYVTPQMFRTAEQEDDTEAFNQAIGSMSDTCNTLYVPAGNYRIDAVKHIRLKSNMNLIMAEGAVLQAINNSEKFYDVIYANNISQVSITGGTIIGERYGHGDTAGEWGMGIGLYDSTDITITGVEIKDCWGDGIYIGSNHEEDSIAGCSRITVRDCDLSNNRRNNLSVVCGDYVTIDNCTFKNANGTAPEYGIDIETNNSDNPCEHIIISNSLFENNGQASMGIVTAADDIKLSGCTLNGTFINYAGTNVTLENTVINGEADARIGLFMTGTSCINDGTETEDELIAAFRADKEEFTLLEYLTDDDNIMSFEIREDTDASSGKALFLKRMTGGTHDAGYYLDLGEWTADNSEILEKGTTYRFEYVVRGTGQWAIKTDQTAWYPCVPMKEVYSTGMVSYKAGGASDCRILLYATEWTKNMYLYIDTIKIYKVK